MAEIQLYQRNQVPQTVQMAKPPMSLASTAGQQSAGASIAGFSGKIFEDLVEAKIGNEIHSFLGQVDTAQAEFEGYVNNNPSASFEDIGNARESMIEGINKAGENLSLPKSKDYAKNWMSSNKEALMIKSQTAVESIISKRELEKFNLLREQYVKSGETDKLTDLYNRQKGKLVDPEISDLMYQSDTKIININKEKNNIFAMINNAAETQSPEDINSVKKIIRESTFIDEQDRFSFNRTLRAQIAERQTQKTEQFKALTESQSKSIAESAIKGMAITETDLLPNVSENSRLINERIATNNLDSGDNITYNFMMEKLSSGEHYTQEELTTNFAKGLSRSQYQKIANENELNRKLSDDLKMTISVYNDNIDTRTQSLDSVINSKIGLLQRPEASASLTQFRIGLKRKIKDMVLEKRPSNEIWKVVNEEFEPDTSGFYKGWFSQTFLNIGAEDFTKTILDETTWESRHDKLIQLIKQGREPEDFEAGEIMDLVDYWKQEDKDKNKKNK
jgi:hypothetical protein